MRVLNIEHRVLGRLALGQIEIEVEVAVVLAEQEEKPRDVNADLGHQLAERDVGRLSGRHFDPLAGARERDELVDDGADRSRVVAERSDRSDNVLVLGNVVGAEHIDDQIEAALQLVDMIGDIGGAIDRLAIGPGTDQNAVLGQSKRLAAKPHRALVFGDQPALAQTFDHRINLAVANEIELVGEDVETDSQFSAGFVDVREDRFLGRGAEDLEVGIVLELVAVNGDELARDVRMYSPWYPSCGKAASIPSSCK